MLKTLLLKVRKNWAFATTICVGLFLSFSCNQKKPVTDPAVTKQLKTVDSLSFIGKNQTAVALLDKIRPLIAPHDPSIIDYYELRIHENFYSPEKANLYADSSLAFFKNDQIINENINAYFKALLNKGDVDLKLGKYIIALNYFYEANKILPKCDCDNGELAGRIAVIYFGQKNYLIAAQYQAKSYNQLITCHKNISPNELFYLTQGALDNTGFTFQKAGLPDSAYYYYRKDIAAIDEADKQNIVHKSFIHSARTVVYDNIGGLDLNDERLDSAKYNLSKALSEAAYCQPSDSISAIIKLAGVNIKQNNISDAEKELKRGKILVDRYRKYVPESSMAWYLTYSQLLFKENNPAEAYRYQGYYLKLRDTINRSLSGLYKVDIEHEFSIIHQQQNVKELHQKELIHHIYEGSAVLIALLFGVIIILISRSLKRSRFNNKLAIQQNEKLQQTLRELELVNKNYVRIMRVMAHDLRNPLSGMTGLASVLLEEGNINEESKHMLRLIETTGFHTIEMISELLKTGLAEDGEKPIKKPLDIKALLYDSIELLQFKAADKGQKIIFDIETSTPIIADVSNEKIWRVINNLIVNAIKFSHTGGVITVGVKSDNKNVLISIADNGIGIPPEQKELIFEMFTPAKKTGTHGEQPFGLGLSISKRIVDMHNGRIWFESEEGRGTTFFVELPLK